MRYFLSRNKELIGRIKIIHLLRDPRGRVNSLRKLSTKLQTDKLNGGKLPVACERQMKDVTIWKQSEKQFPMTFLEIHYEDVAYQIQLPW